MDYSIMEKRLRDAGCSVLRIGKRHAIWYSPITGRNFTVPRYGDHVIHLEQTIQTILEISGTLYYYR